MLFAYFNKYIFTVIFVILFTLLIKYLKLIPKVYYSNLSFGLLATVPIIIVTFVLSYTWRLKKMTATDAITNLILNLIFTAFIQQYLLWSSFTEESITIAGVMMLILTIILGMIFTSKKHKND